MKVSDELLGQIRQSPRQATVEEVADLADDLLELRSAYAELQARELTRRDQLREAQEPLSQLLPPIFATVYVFGVHRKVDTAPWFVAFKDQGMAENYPERCTEVTAVLLYPLGGDPVQQRR